MTQRFEHIFDPPAKIFLFRNFKVFAVVRSDPEYAGRVFLIDIGDKFQRLCGKSSKTDVGQILHFSHDHKYGNVFEFRAEFAITAGYPSREQPRLETSLAQQLIEKSIELIAKPAAIFVHDLFVKLSGIGCDRPFPMNFEVLERYVQQMLILKQLQSRDVRNDTHAFHANSCEIFFDVHSFIIVKRLPNDRMLPHTGPSSRSSVASNCYFKLSIKQNYSPVAQFFANCSSAFRRYY